MASSEYSDPSFAGRDVVVAVLLAFCVEVGLLVLLGTMEHRAGPARDVVLPPKAIAVSINPVVEPKFLKRGSKEKAKLPTLAKPKPQAKKRYEDKSAPSVKAEKQREELPKNDVIKHDEEPPPKDAELARSVEPDIEVDQPEPTLQNEIGHEDGTEDGTETDPLKAHVVSQYRLKLIAWFKAGFVTGDPSQCALSAVATVVISGGTFQSYTLSSSGDAAFDARVRSTLDRKIGQQVPPPPPKYPELLTPTLTTRFSGKNASCK